MQIAVLHASARKMHRLLHPLDFHSRERKISQEVTVASSRPAIFGVLEVYVMNKYTEKKRCRWGGMDYRSPILLDWDLSEQGSSYIRRLRKLTGTSLSVESLPPSNMPSLFLNKPMGN